MISIRKYFDNTTDSGGTYSEGFGRAWSMLAGKLLAAIIEEIFTDEHPRIAPYAGQMKTILNRTVAAASVADIDCAGEQATAILREFRRLRDEIAVGDSAQLQKLIDLLHHAVATLSDGGSRSMARLHRVQQDLDRSSRMNDIKALKACLGECLKYVKQESVNEKEYAEAAIRSMRGEIERATEALPPPRSSFPGREQAESAIQNAAASAGNTAMAVIVLEKFHQVRERFGPHLCERILCMLVEDLSKRLTPLHKVYRWNDHTLALELKDSGDWDGLAGAAKSAIDALPRERRVDVGARMAVLQLPYRWSLFRCSEKNVPEKIERFVNG